MRLSLTALCASFCMAMPAFPGDLPKRVEDVVRVELLPGWRQADGTHIAGLSFQLAKGWKTYWRSPGDGGLPTDIHYYGSRNLDALRILWPRPEVFRTRGVRSIGYQGDVVLPLHLEPVRDGDIDLNLSLDFGVCEDVCIPVSLTFSHQLPQTASQKDQRIQAALKEQPAQSSDSLACRVEPMPDGVAVTVNMHAPELPGRGEAVVIEATDGNLWVSEPVVARQGDYLTATSQLVSQDNVQFSPETHGMRVTVISSQAAMSFEGCSGF